MSRKHYTAEQIIRHLREAEILLGKGETIGIVAKSGFGKTCLFRAILDDDWVRGWTSFVKHLSKNE